uniref:Uncharacterized protein n=1 Tax=Anguilla anguilla TaxID=7936 RepID=A0A0E9UAG6_ANGAN
MAVELIGEISTFRVCFS